MTSGVAAALDANFAALIRWYAERPGGEIARHPDVTMCSTGLAFRAVNGAVGMDLDAASADRRIVEVSRWFADRVGPWRWLVGPTARPVDLGDRLERAGFELVGDNPGMALDLAGFAAPPPPAGVEIGVILAAEELAHWGEVQRRGLGLANEGARAWQDAHDRAVEPDSRHRIWLARLDGEPVGAAALFDAEDVAGVYNVATVPESRRRGIGRAVTQAVLAEAVRRGHRTAVLGACEMGYPLYHGLGFGDVSRLRSYASPSSA